MFLILDLSCQAFYFYSYFSYDGDVAFSEQSREAKGWCIFNRIFDAFGFVLLIWLLRKMKFIDLALKELKDSDEFNPEHLEENASDCDKKQKKKQI